MSSARDEPSEDHLVVVLHGLGRGRGSMAPMAWRLGRAGYRVENIGYASRRGRLEDHVATVEARLVAIEGARRVSFVTHSLGGIVVRALFARPRTSLGRLEPARAVMLAPPNRGSALAAALHRGVGIERLLGPSVLDIIREAETLPTPPLQVGVIAGSQRGGRGLNPMLEGDDDAIVRVEETRLEGARDFLVLPALHTTIMLNPRVQSATLSFLATGSFGINASAEGADR